MLIVIAATMLFWVVAVLVVIALCKAAAKGDNYDVDYG